MGKIIGIDLGTTNSCVAVLEGKDPVVIPNNEGRNTTPSVVAFVDGGERKVGDPAKRQAITNPTRTVYSIKRFMGEKYDKVLEEVKRVPYKVVNQNNMPKVDIDGREYTPQEISAMVLQKMKKTAEDYLGQPVTEAIITATHKVVRIPIAIRRVTIFVIDYPLKIFCSFLLSKILIFPLASVVRMESRCSLFKMRESVSGWIFKSAAFSCFLRPLNASSSVKSE